MVGKGKEEGGEEGRNMKDKCFDRSPTYCL